MYLKIFVNSRRTRRVAYRPDSLCRTQSYYNVLRLIGKSSVFKITYPKMVLWDPLVWQLRLDTYGRVDWLIS